MRILIADKLPSEAMQRLVAAGHDVVVDPGLKDAALKDALVSTGARVVVVRSTRLTADALQASRLGLVVRAGAGVNTIDVDAASALGIYVANCPGKNSLAVAELAIGMLVALDRRIPDAVAELRAGRWNKAEYSRARGLAGRTLGVVGLGRIGRAVAARALGLQMRVLTWDRRVEVPTELTGRGALRIDELPAMLRRCDAVTVHLPSTPETEKLVDTRFLDAMQDGAFLVNTSRADLVDEPALLRAIEAKGLRVAVDVFDDEVSGGTGEVSSALLDSPSVIATPHIGASTDQAQEAVADEAVRIVLRYAAAGVVDNVVNVEERSPASHLLVVRHLNRVGVLSHVFAALRDASINAEETQNIVFSGSRSCIARVALDAAPDPAMLDALQRGNPDILDLDLVPLNAD